MKGMIPSIRMLKPTNEAELIRAISHLVLQAKRLGGNTQKHFTNKHLTRAHKIRWADERLGTLSYAESLVDSYFGKLGVTDKELLLNWSYIKAFNLLEKKMMLSNMIKKFELENESKRIEENESLAVREFADALKTKRKPSVSRKTA